MFSTDIVDGEVKSVDIGNNEIGSIDVKDGSINTFDVHSFLGVDVVDGSLEDQDIAQGTFVNFAASIGLIASHGCNTLSITGINAQGDHLLLTPSNHDHSALTYEVQYRTDSDSARLFVCNPTDANIDDGTTHFNLLVIDAN